MVEILDDSQNLVYIYIYAVKQPYLILALSNQSFTCWGIEFESMLEYESVSEMLPSSSDISLNFHVIMSRFLLRINVHFWMK